MQREQEERGELGGEGLGAGDADLGAGVGGDGSLGLAGDGGADDVADGDGAGAEGVQLALGGDGVGRLAGLGDEQADGGGVGDGRAVAELAGVVDFGAQAGEALDHELAGEAGVPTGAAGGDGDLAGGAQFGVGEMHLGEEDAAGVGGDAAEDGVADGAGLLVDLLEHEVLVAGLFGLDGVPGDALDAEGDGVGVEVGEGDAGGGEDGEFAVGEEVDVAGVMEDAGNVGCEEEFAVAETEDDRRAKTRGDELIGLVGREHANGKGAGETLDGAADSFLQRDGRLAAGEGENGLRGIGFCGGGGIEPQVLRLRAPRSAQDDTIVGSGGGSEVELVLDGHFLFIFGGEVELVLDEVGDDFGVGLGDELVAAGDEFGFEGEVVLHDAVVHDDERAGAVAVGVGVLLGGAAVGGPAGVADAEGAGDGAGGDGGLKIAELAGGAAQLQALRAAGDGDAG